MRVALLEPGTDVADGVVRGGVEEPRIGSSARGWRDGQRKVGRGPSNSWQAMGKGFTTPTRPAKMARRAEEGDGGEDMAGRFLRNRLVDGRGLVDFGLAIPSAKY